MRLNVWIICFAIFLPQIGSAQNLLLDFKDWRAVRDTTDSGIDFCMATTASAGGRQMLSLALTNSGMLISISDANWSLSQRPISFLLDIDYSRWRLTGNANNSIISAMVAKDVEMPNFIEELSQGSAIALYNLDEKPLGVFSLRGSHAALQKTFECFDTLKDKSDPFVTNKDPFL